MGERRKHNRKVSHPSTAPQASSPPDLASSNLTSTGNAADSYNVPATTYSNSTQASYVPSSGTSEAYVLPATTYGNSTQASYAPSSYAPSSYAPNSYTSDSHDLPATTYNKPTPHTPNHPSLSFPIRSKESIGDPCSPNTCAEDALPPPQSDHGQPGLNFAAEVSHYDSFDSSQDDFIPRPGNRNGQVFPPSEYPVFSIMQEESSTAGSQKEVSTSIVGSSRSGANSRSGGHSSRSDGHSSRDGGISSRSGGNSRRGGNSRSGGHSSRSGGHSSRSGGHSSRSGGHSSRDGGISSRSGGNSRRGGNSRSGGNSSRSDGHSSRSDGHSSRDSGHASRDGGISSRSGGNSSRSGVGERDENGLYKQDGKQPKLKNLVPRRVHDAEREAKEKLERQQRRHSSSGNEE